MSALKESTPRHAERGVEGRESSTNAVNSRVAPESAPIEITAYSRKEDTAGRRESHASWSDVVDRIIGLVRDSKTKAREGLPCWAPHMLSPGESRNAGAVERVTLAVLDVDEDLDLNALLSAIERERYAALVYETPSSTTEAPRVRVVVPLDEPHATAMCGPVRRALAERLGVTVDPKTLDPSRLYFAGRVSGTRARKSWLFEGKPTSIADLGAQADDGAERWVASSGDGRTLPGLGTATEDAIASTLALLERVWPERGEPHGERHAKGRALGGWLTRRGWGDDAIADVMSRLDASGATVAHRVDMALDAARRARAGLAAPGYQELERLFDRVTLGDLDEAATDSIMPTDWPTNEHPWSVWWQRAYAPGGLVERLASSRKTKPREAAAPLPPAKQRKAGAPPSLVVTRGGGSASYFVHDYRDAEKQGTYVECGLHAVHLTLRETGAEHYVQTHTGGRHSKRRSVADITNEEALGVDRVEWDFARPGSYVLDQSGPEPRMVRGIDCPQIEPVFDAAADEWLRLVAGSEPKRVALHEWIASCRQDRIHRLSTAMVAVGPHGIGKSLTPIVLARMWGAPKPVDLAHVVKQFNAGMTACPIVADDECKTLGRRTVSTEEFRSIVQERQRSFEPKNKEQRVLHGAQRFWISTNDLGAFTFSNAMGAGALDALAERLLIVHVPEERAAGVREALDQLRDQTGEVVLDRLLGHFAWIQESTAVPDESVRFLGADGDRASARGALLGSVVGAHAPLFERLRQALQPSAKASQGIYIQAGRVLVRPDELAVSLAESSDNADRWNGARVREALAPLSPGSSATFKHDGKTVRAMPIDRRRLLEALAQ